MHAEATSIFFANNNFVFDGRALMRYQPNKAHDFFRGQRSQAVIRRSHPDRINRWLKTIDENGRSI